MCLKSFYKYSVNMMLRLELFGIYKITSKYFFN